MGVIFIINVVILIAAIGASIVIQFRAAPPEHSGEPHKPSAHKVLVVMMYALVITSVLSNASVAYAFYAFKEALRGF